jgi:AraC-like DNA-binding protein
MADQTKERLHYLTVNSRDEEWGIVVTTVGSQIIPSRGSYPPVNHPASYRFKPQQGRILNEYQLVYITEGSGFFSSQSCKKQKISAGTMILLFPGEWHSYYPDKEIGWQEYWVGFRGVHIDKRVEKGFFRKEEPLHKIGVTPLIISLYDEIMQLATQENAGYQQMISSIVLHILGTVYYKEVNNPFSNTYVTEKINEARLLMRDNVENPMSPVHLAEHVGVGYSWFRKMFKQYTGISPAQYQIQLRIMRAKELLMTTDLNITEIAYQLNFEDGGCFSTFFKNKEGITPSEFRERTH